MARSTEPTPSTRAQRQSGTGRLLAIDAARGLAMVGMVIVNVGPTRTEGVLGRLYLAPYGRASILFVLIAGLGMSFFLRSRRDDARRWPVLLWRAGLLFFGGLALQLLTPQIGVILPTYGLLFALALALQYVPRSALLWLTLVWAVAGPVVIVMHTSAGAAVRHLTEPVTLTDPVGQIVHSSLVSGPYPLLSWAVPFMVGMWVAGLELSRRPTQHAMILWGGVAAVGGLAVSLVTPGLLGASAEEGYLKLLTGAAHGQMPLWLVSSVGGAILVLGLLLRFWDRIATLARPLVYAGQLALTCYVGHYLVLAATGKAETLAGGMVLSAVIVVGLLVFSWVWRSRYAIGPLERVVRASWLRPVGGATRPVAP